jgi:hypothetical protein
LFGQLDSEEQMKVNPTGTGLGLKNAYDLAKKLGPPNNNGIEVISELNKGSTFYFTILNIKNDGLNEFTEEFKVNEIPNTQYNFMTTIKER